MTKKFVEQVTDEITTFFTENFPDFIRPSHSSHDTTTPLCFEFMTLEHLRIRTTIPFITRTCTEIPKIKRVLMISLYHNAQNITPLILTPTRFMHGWQYRVQSKIDTLLQLVEHMPICHTCGTKRLPILRLEDISHKTTMVFFYCTQCKDHTKIPRGIGLRKDLNGYVR